MTIIVNNCLLAAAIVIYTALDAAWFLSDFTGACDGSVDYSIKGKFDIRGDFWSVKIVKEK